MTYKLLVSSILMILLTACGSDDNNSQVTENINQIEEDTTAEIVEADDKEVTTAEIVEADDKEVTTAEIVKADDKEVTTAEIVKADDKEITTAEIVKANDKEVTTPEIVKANDKEVTTPEIVETDETDEDNTPITVPAPTLLTGVFLDSAVEGINFSTASQSGKTNEQGEFTFLVDENITFSIGGIELPTIPAALYLTPLSVFDTDDINQTEVVNLLRLLQTLDTDGDASNGITIMDSIHTLAADLNIDFSADDFTTQVATLVSDSGAANQTLVDTDDAIAHFQLTLNDINDTEMTSCTKTNAKVGQSGFFDTRAHNVTGKATIIDDCTIEISQFTYDGQGPVVYFYGAIGHQYADQSAFALGKKLTGTVFNNDTLTITLPQGKSLDDLTGLSVWCVDFDANFGQMEFSN